MTGKIIWYTVHVLIWFGVFLLLSPWPLHLGLFRYPDLNAQPLTIFLAYSMAFNAAMIYLYAHRFLPVYQSNGSLAYLSAVNAGFLLAFAVIESPIDFLFVHTLSSRAPEGHFSDIFRFNLLSNLLMMIVANLYGFSHAWFRDREQKQQLEQEKLKAELSALRHQVHPHFLFNVLNSLYGLALRHSDSGTADGIAKLSDMMRYMLYESNATQVLLERELDYLRSYIDLQRLRLPALTQVKFEVVGEEENQRLAPMMLISFIENAFKHGVSTVRKSEIEIQVVIEKNRLNLFVINDIHPDRSEGIEQPGGIGLENVRKRLNLLYGPAFQLEQGPVGEQYRVALSIPL